MKGENMKHILRFIGKYHKKILKNIILAFIVIGIAAYEYGVIASSDEWMLVSFISTAFSIILIYADFMIDKKWK